MIVVLQESLRAVFYAPFYAALALGAYRDEGLQVHFASAPTPDQAAHGLLDGSVDVSWGGPMRVMQTYALRPDCDLVCFGEAVTRDPFFLVGRTPNPGYRPSDLAGLRLATVSEVPTPWLCLQEDVRRAGLDPTSLQRITGRAMAQNAATLREGEIDVAQLFQPYVEELVEGGAGHIWYAAADRGPTSYTTFYARRAFLTDRSAEARAMVRGLQRTLTWLQDAGGPRIAQTIAAYFPQVPASRLAAALERYKRLGVWGRDACLPREGYERLRQSLVSGGFVATGTPYEVAVDNTLAREAARAGLSPPRGG